MSLRKRPSAAKKIAGDDAEKTVVSNELLYPTLKACAVLCALLVRAAVGMWGYSGQGKPPMYGDFEAQRHWMEITTATPIGEW